VHPAPVWGTANMGTLGDGTPPEMNMGLVASTVVAGLATVALLLFWPAERRAPRAPLPR